MRSQGYQFSLISLGAIITVLFGIFVWRELFPEYRIYQQAYVALENFRAGVTGQEPAEFKEEVKQVVLPMADKGPETIDRCVSCHVAMKLGHFSPTKIAKDINGNTVVDKEGSPLLVENEDYLWKWVDDKIAALKDEKALQNLREAGKGSEAESRIEEAEALESLQHVEVGEAHYDMRKVLAMHPLLGREERPFEFHPIEEFGCTSCHNGNGRGLVTDRAHGPVFDGTYEEMPMGPHREFTEKDPQNDPQFAKVFNHKPGHRLLFQTTPILVGDLMQSQCVQCHQSSLNQLDGAIASVGAVTKSKGQQLHALRRGVKTDKQALVALLEIRQSLREGGLNGALRRLQSLIDDISTDKEARDSYENQQEFLQQVASQVKSANEALDVLRGELVAILGSDALVTRLENKASVASDLDTLVDQFVEESRTDSGGEGALYAKQNSIDEIGAAVQRLETAVSPIAILQEEREVIDVISTDADRLTTGFQRGKDLFVSTACYGCHRIAGFSRGGVGPELSDAGLSYPWFLKESIVWPQADLASSTMPNFKLDSEEIEDLLAFLLAQKGEKKAVAEVTRRVQIKDWEAGAKTLLERPLPPNQIKDFRNSQVIFATQGCSSCHKLQGFDTSVGFAIDLDSPSVEERLAESRWFKKLFPDNVAGSLIVKTIEKHAEELDRRVIDGVRDDAIVAQLEKDYPRLVEALYSNFKYASRAKNHEFEGLAQNATTDEQRVEAQNRLVEWQARVRRIMHAYIQEYGYGRDIGPRLHWSGLYRDTEWLVGHFRNPAAHTAKSIMPVLPFDDTKFYALTYLLQDLAKANRDHVRQIWEKEGFSPQEAFSIHCAACHGDFLQGNGVIADWIYPIPKNLRDPTFLRNLTKERAIQSIVHGVRGGPMPPWGEAQGGEQPVLTLAEIEQLVDWLFQGIPGARVIKGKEDVPKWQYTPEDVLRDIEDEGGLDSLQSTNERLKKELQGCLSKGEGLYASLNPVVYTSGERGGRESLEASDLFDVVANPFVQGAEKELFYIKKRFYTPKNLMEGERLFIANCSHCHGKEGAGNGERAAAMEDAKPRMLSNLPWLRTRDDLRLLRSIKFGVAGTSMTPWGDKTDALQRMQLVMFIRRLSEEKRLREDLTSALFQTFELGTMVVDEARADHFAEVEQLRQNYKETAQRRLEAHDKVQVGELSPNDASSVYAQELELAREIKGKESLDGILRDLISQLSQEKSIFDNIGRTFIQRDIDAEIMAQYLRLVHLMGDRFELREGELTFHVGDDRTDELKQAIDTVVGSFDQKIAALERKRQAAKGKLPSSQRNEELGEIDLNINAIQQMKGLLISGLRKAEKLRKQQAGTYEKYLAQRDT